MNIRVLYHANCLDGFGAAFAAFKRFGDQATYEPCRYDEGSGPLAKCQDGDEVYVVDFSFKRNDLIEHAKRFSRLLVLDHHKTAREDLIGLDFCVFDMNRSGAVLAWNHFFPRETIPPLIFHIQDRDLWQWRMPGTRELTIALYSLPMKFDSWNRYLTDSGINELKERGKVLVERMEQDVKMSTAKAGSTLIGGHRVPIVNTRAHISEIGQELLNKFPDAPFSASFYLSPHKGTTDWRMHVSLRSRAGGVDVSEIAKSYGGGGHREASGFSVAASFEAWLSETP